MVQIIVGSILFASLNVQTDSRPVIAVVMLLTHAGRGRYHVLEIARHGLTLEIANPMAPTTAGPIRSVLLNAQPDGLMESAVNTALMPVLVN
jgi:hypothetical protein